MLIVTENSMIQKYIIQKIFLLVAFFSMQSIFASIVTFDQEIFRNYFFENYIKSIKGIDELQKNYCNFCLLSKEYNQKTKSFWNENWFSIMKDVCNNYRYERIYFAAKFKRINKDIEYYFWYNYDLFMLAFDQNPMIQSLAQPQMPWGLGTMEGRRSVTIKGIKCMDPSFTTFGPNGQMSLLECAIKTYSRYFDKINICKYIIKQGAQYDIWIPGILKKEKELAFLKSDFSFFKNTYNADASFLKKMRKPMLLSYFIAHHKDLNYDLAKLIVIKGTASQNDFINRFPDLEQYRKEEIISPPFPPDFEIKNSFSLFRAYELESLIPRFFENHFGRLIYQPLNYKKAYEHYSKLAVNSDQKTMLDYVSKKLENPTVEKDRLQIITVLKYDFLQHIQLPKKLKWYLIEFAISQSKKRVILLVTAFFIIHMIMLANMWQCVITFSREQHLKSLCHFGMVAFMLCVSSFMRFKEKIKFLRSKDTLYDPYYFIHF